MISDSKVFYQIGNVEKNSMEYYLFLKARAVKEDDGLRSFPLQNKEDCM